LRKAVERHDWVLHYHPIMHLADRQMVGVEALLRWQDSDGNLVPPGEFIMAAEDMGLIEAVGDWVLEEVCRQSRAWRDEGLELDTSINLSPRQLWQPNLVQRIVSHLDSTGVDPETVVIEITESAATADPDRTLRVLREFRDRGLRLAIDDFGTAASSINRLKDLPVDILKVDQSFVRRLPADRDAARMARAIVGLGHSLGMVPLAEGIDSEDQREFLVRSGCPLGQGYLFGKPMPADAITALCLADEPPSPAGSGEEHQREPRMPVDPPARTAPSPPAVRMPPMTPTAQEPPAKRSAPDLQVLPGEPPPRDDEPAAPDNPSFYPRPSPEPDLDAIFGRDPSEEPPAEPGDTRAERRGKASGSGG
jgi:EAL domain-containing protein (putative c-di-GMP-specific phosphodiesterase class I)